MGLLKAFFTEFTILSSVNPLNPIPLNATLLSAAPLKCVSMNNQECKVRPEIVNVKRDELYFILLVLKQVNAVVVLTISTIHTQKCLFLMF